MADTRNVILRGREEGETPAQMAGASPRPSSRPAWDVALLAGSFVLALLTFFLARRGPASPRATELLLLAGALFGTAVAGFLYGRARSRLEQELAHARRIGNWKLDEMLGRGGMGEVWRASHVLLPRPAAIKFIRPEALGAGDAASSRTAIQRFRREARAVASLTSPHTIEIYDFGVAEDGSLSYVMEFLEGLDLQTLVRETGPLPAARAVYLLRQVCISIAEAHLAGLVHRDLKPANIYACKKGIQHDFVKVLDFGMVADLTGRVDGTPTTDIGGTPAYVAPEIVTGKGCDGRSDLYSLGCVAYFLLTGETVFAGQTTPEQLRHHIHSRPEAPSRKAPHAVPRELDLAVLACLAKSPDERPRSAADFSRKLSACDVGPAWTPGQAMEWWTAREQGRPPRADSAEIPNIVSRPNGRPASAIVMR